MSKQALALVNLLISLHQQCIHKLIAFKNEAFPEDQLNRAIEYSGIVDKMNMVKHNPFSANKLHTGEGRAYHNVEVLGNIVVRADGSLDSADEDQQYNDHCK